VKWNSASVADGLVFGIISGETNTTQALGGDPNMGELMGWAGPGISGYGLRPPKIGIEFDTWYNACGSTVYNSGSRCDPDTYSHLDHLVYVFWGSNTKPSPTRSNTYDDNRHGAGSGSSTEPVMSNDPDGSGSGQFGVYYTSTNNWLRGGTKNYFRHELTRLTTASSGSTYCYLLKTWITSSTPSTAFQNVTMDYDAAANPPTLQQVLFLNAAYHQQLNKILFGWTEATGAYTQNITVGNFRLAFKKNQPTYGTAPAGATLHWPMYDNVGTNVTDASGSGRTGTINGTARWVPGIMNNNGAALYFNGSTGATAVDNTALDLTSIGGISLWFNSKAANTGKWLLRKGAVSTTINRDLFDGSITSTTTDNTEGYGLYIDNSGFLRCRLRYGTAEGSYLEAISTTKPLQNAWYHVAVTWNGASLKLYMNGIEESTITTSGNIAQDSGDMLCLGANPTTTTTNYYIGTWLIFTTVSTSYGGFTGIIDELYLYKQVLTPANVAALATGTP